MAPKAKIVSKKHVARLERERRQVRLIQFVAIGVVAAIFLVLAYGYLDLNYLQARQPVAEVNGEKITSKEFEARVVLQRNELLTQYMQYLQYQQLGLDISAQLQQIEFSLDTPSMVGQQVLDALIDEALIRQEAARRGITVTEEELETFTREQFGFFPDGSPTPTITPTEVTIAYPTLSAAQLDLVTATPAPTEGPTSTPLPTATVEPAVTPEATSTPAPTPLPSPTATPYTLEGYQIEFEEVLTSMAELGLTEEQYRRLFETRLLRSKLLEEVAGDLPAEEEQVWARHILVADEEAAKAVIGRLNNGEDFGVMAVELSEDTGSGAQGGDLGWFGKGQMVPVFEATAFSLTDGEISEPVQSNFGWHIIQTLGHATLPISANAYEQARQAAFNIFLAGLREEAALITYDEFWLERVPTSPSLGDLGQPQQ